VVGTKKNENKTATNFAKDGAPRGRKWE